MSAGQHINGARIIKNALKTMPDDPGVYRMFNAEGDVLYVGKAKNLKKRVTNYTQVNRLVPRIARMVMATASMEITTTRTEAEALLLEANLIKSLKPRYNILLRDDKSFPYIALSAPLDKDPKKGHAYPRISKHRGAKQKHAYYFGPFPSAGAVNQAINTLQKAFLLRPCTDGFFKSRTRPCMEYQIKRCSAPCVNLVSEEDYAAQAQQAIAFLEGRADEVKSALEAQMMAASDAMEYERAAAIRNRIQALTQIQSAQSINNPKLGDADVIAIAGNGQQACIAVFFVRGGNTLGTRSYFPQHTEERETGEILEAFLGQFYQRHPAPRNILLSDDIPARRVLEEALSEHLGNRVSVAVPLRGDKRAMLEVALANATAALERHQAESAQTKDLLKQVQTLFALPKPPERIEVYDNSHLFGKQPVGAMIVAGMDGFNKQAYRKFNVDAGEKTTGGDDYDMLRQVLRRRFARMKEAQKTDGAEGMSQRPDLVIIDGGIGQLSAAMDVWRELALNVPLVCMAKGEDRNAGKEIYHRPNMPEMTFEPNSPLAYYFQRIRDEAHRFAITSHRGKRDKDLRTSVLDDIPGIGARRKKALLNYFGSAKGVQTATVAELMRAGGISKSTAEAIHGWFNE